MTTQQTTAYSNEHIAIEIAQELSNANGSPVGIIQRDGWFAVCEDPEVMEDMIAEGGWTDYALVEPQDGR